MAKRLKSATIFLVIVTVTVSIILAYTLYIKIEIAVFFATAIGTFAYVIFTYWDQHIASPNLQILFDSSKPSEYTPQLEMFDMSNRTSLGPFRFIRVLVRNCGSRPAHGCVAQVTLKERPAGCTMFSEEPKTLKWVDIPTGDYIPPRGGNAVLGVAFSMQKIKLILEGKRCTFQNNSQPTINTLAHTPEALANPSIRAQDSFCVGDFKIRLTVYCEEVNPISKDYILEVNEDWQKLNMRPPKN